MTFAIVYILIGAFLAMLSEVPPPYPKLLLLVATWPVIVACVIMVIPATIVASLCSYLWEKISG